MQLPSAVLTAAGWLAYEFSRLQPFIPMYLHLIGSAIFPIYTGAHSSLSRPSSAAKRSKTNKKARHLDSDSEDEDDEPLRMEGLSPSDALLFPILAGITLVGLYIIIKWLQDPAILNMILNWYFATFSVFSVSRLVSDSLDVLHSLIFPRDYLDQGVIYRVRPKLKLSVPSIPGPSPRNSPLPSIFSRIPFPQALIDFFWVLQVLPSRKVQFKAYIRRLLDLRFGLGIHGLEGLLVGLATVLWYNFVSKPWFLTNIMGFGFAYGTLQILSPTTFWTGSLILSGLFFYDIYFVFFTPVMVTVAKSLDIPVKLLFPRPPDPSVIIEPGLPPPKPSLSMLGLGDIVLPGIIIGLALRFDLFMFYLRKQVKSGAATPNRRSPSSKRSPSSSSSSPSKSANDNPASETGSVVKAPYTSVAESWGDRLWTASLFTGSRGPTSAASRYVARNAFPKPYFHAALVGYIIGMLTTLGAMQISDHAQPALLYLVPGVLVALWGRAWSRGELKEMWAFSDAGEEDEEGSNNEKDKNAKDKKENKSPSKKKADTKDTEESKDASSEQDHKNESNASRTPSQRKSFFSLESNEARVKKIETALAKNSGKKDGGVQGDKEHEGRWFAFSMTLPSLSPTGSTSKSLRKKKTSDAAALSEDNSPRYSLRSTGRSDEHVEKRLRVR